MSVEERFLAKTAADDNGCLIWRGALGGRYSNYGMFAWPDRRSMTTAHRVSHLLFKGPIPDSYHVDHLCKNTLCVNPDHLEAVTAAENNLRSDSPSALNARKTECPVGHPYDEINTYIEPKGSRVCRECRRVRERALPNRPLTSQQRARKTELQRRRRAALAGDDHA